MYFKKYIKKPLIALLIAITGLLTLSLFVEVSANTGGIPSYEFLPDNEEQYLSNDALPFDFSIYSDFMSFDTHKIRVKPNTTYTFAASIIYIYYNTSFEGVNVISAYDLDKNYIIDLDKNERDLNGQRIITFTTTADTHYIYFDEIEYSTDDPQGLSDVVEKIEDILILFEGIDDVTYTRNDSKEYINKDYFYHGPKKDKTPVLDGETAFVTNVDNPMSVQDILTHITAMDAEDGDITHKIVIENDNYTANNKILGTYELDISVTDNAGNRAELKIFVLVKDATAPVFTGPKTVNANITTLKNVEEIKSLLSVSDNYDTTPPVIKIDSNEYQANYNKIGSWPIVFSATDSSGNKGTHIVNVVVIDNVAPVISGPKTILKNQTETLTLSQIKSQLTANDNVDGNITNNIVVESDGYTGKGHIVGVYTIVFSVSDNAGNKAIHEVKISVKDNVPPVFFVDNFFINVSQSLILTNEDIKNLLIATGQIENVGTTTMRFLLNEYAGHENEIGIYAVTIETTSSSGREDIINLAVKVNEDTTNDDDIIINEPTIFKKIFNHVFSYWYFYLPTLLLIIIIASKQNKKYKYRRK